MATALEQGIARIERGVLHARSSRMPNVGVAVLRIILGFALVPSGLKKVIDAPFTDPSNTGPFHEFLHAFQATGFFYQFVGGMQLTAAVLLFSQRFATLGAAVLLPILTTILVFCWSTEVYPTASVVTLMFLGTLGLLLWDLQKWRGLFASDVHPADFHVDPLPPVVDLVLWRRCGMGILIAYLALCGVSGEIYRPRGVELDNPAFYSFPLLMLFPVVTFVIDQARYRARVARPSRADLSA